MAGFGKKQKKKSPSVGSFLTTQNFKGEPRGMSQKNSVAGKVLGGVQVQTKPKRTRVKNRILKGEGRDGFQIHILGGGDRKKTPKQKRGLRRRALQGK